MHLVSTIDLVYKYFIYEFLHLCSCHKKESNWQNNANVDKGSNTDQHMKIVLRLWDSVTLALWMDQLLWSSNPPKVNYCLTRGIIYWRIIPSERIMCVCGRGGVVICIPLAHCHLKLFWLRVHLLVWEVKYKNTSTESRNVHFS